MQQYVAYSAEAIIAPSHSDIAIKILSKEDLLEIQDSRRGASIRTS